MIGPSLCNINLVFDKKKKNRSQQRQPPPPPDTVFGISNGCPLLCAAPLLLMFAHSSRSGFRAGRGTGVMVLAARHKSPNGHATNDCLREAIEKKRQINT